MNTEIIVAIIGASAVIFAAVITGIFSFFSKVKDKESSKIRLTQKQYGENNTQIGIQNNYGGYQDE